MVVALSYYGISYSAGSIGDDLFVSNILIALVGKTSPILTLQATLAIAVSSRVTSIFILEN